MLLYQIDITLCRHLIYIFSIRLCTSVSSVVYDMEMYHRTDILAEHFLFVGRACSRWICIGGDCTGMGGHSSVFLFLPLALSYIFSFILSLSQPLFHPLVYIYVFIFSYTLFSLPLFALWDMQRLYIFFMVCSFSREKRFRDCFYCCYIGYILVYLASMISTGLSLFRSFISTTEKVIVIIFESFISILIWGI